MCYLDIQTIPYRLMVKRELYFVVVDLGASVRGEGVYTSETLLQHVLRMVNGKARQMLRATPISICFRNCRWVSKEPRYRQKEPRWK